MPTDTARDLIHWKIVSITSWASVFEWRPLLNHTTSTFILKPSLPCLWVNLWGRYQDVLVLQLAFLHLADYVSMFPQFLLLFLIFFFPLLLLPLPPFDERVSLWSLAWIKISTQNEILKLDHRDKEVRRMSWLMIVLACI